MSKEEILKDTIYLSKEKIKIDYKMLEELYQSLSNFNTKFLKPEFLIEDGKVVYLAEKNHLTSGFVYRPEELNNKIKNRGFTIYEKKNYKLYSNISLTGSIIQLKKEGKNNYIIQFSFIGDYICILNTKTMKMIIESKKEYIKHFIKSGVDGEAKLKKAIELANNILNFLSEHFENLKKRKQDINNNYKRLLKITTKEKNNKVLNEINKKYNEISLC